MTKIRDMKAKLNPDDKEKIRQDMKLQQMFIRKNLSKSRIDLNIIAFTKMYELTGLTPTELIDEALEEQEPRLINGQLRFKQINDRKITRYLYNYYFFLQQENYKLQTIQTRMATVRAFYNEYDVELPKNIQLQNNKPLVTEGDLPARKDILKALQSTNNKRNKALILFLASTGIRSNDALEFKVHDLIQGCKNYNVTSLNELLNIDADNVVPGFYFRPQKTIRSGNICCTFCTPECFKSLQDYLKTRPYLTEDSPLFTNRFNEKLSRDAVIRIFKTINDNEFGFVNNQRFFKAHNLRKWFVSQCNQHSGDLLKVHILAGHSISRIDATYNEINVDVMRRFYISLIPHLTVNPTRVKSVKSREYLELERRLKEQELENQRLKEEFDRRLDSLVNEAVERVLSSYL